MSVALPIKYPLRVFVGVRIAMLFVSGWWLVMCALRVLPYFAMIIANVKVAPQQGAVERPATIVLYQEKSS
jgi:hypothetical protein